MGCGLDPRCHKKLWGIFSWKAQKLHNHFDFIGLYNTRGTTATKYTGSGAPIIHIMDGKNGWQMNVTHGIVCKPWKDQNYTIILTLSAYTIQGGLHTATKYTGSGAPIIRIMDGKNGWQMNVTHGIVCKPKTHSDLMKKPIHLLTRY